jgi:hypothetical protein
MTVTVAEYLGIDVKSGKSVPPVSGGKGTQVPCPFRAGSCSKVSKGNKPVCSVRDGSGELWIVCEHRLCATSPKDAPLTEYQSDVLISIAKTLWGPSVEKSDVAVRREVPVKTEGRSDSRADYVMVPTSDFRSKDTTNTVGPVVLEMQGGGETSQTGALTAQVGKWEVEPLAATEVGTLIKPVTSVGTIEANAWRRQQEQFLYKGNVAVNSFGRLVFAVGSKLYDYLMNNLASTAMQDMRGANWTLALVAISEDNQKSDGSFSTSDSVPLKVDENRLLFTSYPKFVQALINQGGSDPEMFRGSFLRLDGHTITVS